MKSALAFFGVVVIVLFGMSVFADTSTSGDSQEATGHFVGGGSVANLFVSHSEFIFTADDGTETERIATILNVFFTSGQDNFFGCYVIPEEDLEFDPGLQRAALHTTVSGPSNCGSVQRADGQPVQMAPAGVSVAADLRIDVQWFYYGAVGQSKGSFSETCELFSTQNDYQTMYAFSAGIGKVASSSRFASAPRLAASFARLSGTHSETSRSGSRSLACGGGFSFSLAR